MCDPIEAETALSVVKEEFGHLSHVRLRIDVVLGGIEPANS